MLYLLFLNVASFDASESADLSTLFDVGGIVGGIIAGVLSDVTGMSAVTCAVMLVVAIPMVILVHFDSLVAFLNNSFHSCLLTFLALHLPNLRHYKFSVQHPVAHVCRLVG